MKNASVKLPPTHIISFLTLRGTAPTSQERITTEADRLHTEYLTLQDLRKTKELTQTNRAETLDIRQATVAQMEKRSDLMLSTLRSYVQAMGDSLSLMVEFPIRKPVILDGLGDTEEPSRKLKKAGRKAQTT